MAKLDAKRKSFPFRALFRKNLTLQGRQRFTNFCQVPLPSPRSTFAHSSCRCGDYLLVLDHHSRLGGRLATRSAAHHQVRAWRQLQQGGIPRASPRPFYRTNMT